MVTSFVIVGTDTNVGKTVLSAVLLSSDPSLHYWKPIQSGLHEETDTQTIAR
ncbi:MAG TPA: AAA family ATPase, partial [Candidatus Kapabacteria bacterium]|nr:AAA family ATPase [Candidatus Kapabacteria bacterium]